MLLQGFMGGANPLLVLAAALVLFLLFYFKRGADGNLSSQARLDSEGRGSHAGHGTDEVRASAQAVTHSTHGSQPSSVAAHSAGSAHATSEISVSAGTYERITSAAGYDFTDETLRRHNSRTFATAGAASATASTAPTAASHGHAAGNHRTSHHDGGAATGSLHTPSIPHEYVYSDGGGRGWVFPLVFALCAGLVSCQVASEKGVIGSIASWFGGSKPLPQAAAKIEAKVDAVKAKIAEAAPAPKPAAAPAPAPAPAKVAEAPPSPPVEIVPGKTSYYGFSTKPDSAQAWAAAATVFAAAAEPAAPVAKDEAAPAPTSGVGQTSYFGIAEKPDATFPWAAPATFFGAIAEAAPTPVAAASEPAPASAGGVGQTSYFGLAEKPDATFPWAAPATVYAGAAEPAAAPEPAPVSLGGVGQTSYFGLAEKPDATFPWAAPATVYAKAAAPAAPAPAPTPAAIENCRDALNAEAQAGKINFAVSSFEILPDSYKTLDRIAKLAKDCGGVVIEVGGHTDSTGKPASNKTLSQLRAQAVVRYLSGAGVEAGKLKAMGYGQDRPVADNATTEGKRKNRRIEFLVSAP
jgi:outer membrane protein OmpA-like peptidoglycan-associated protein